jgi:hypothetical protein
VVRDGIAYEVLLAGGSEFGRVGSPFVSKRIEFGRKTQSLWQTRICHGERKELGQAR